jgi:hypothetical protein
VVVAAGADVFLSKEAGKSAGADAGAAPARLQKLEQQDQQAPQELPPVSTSRYLLPPASSRYLSCLPFQPKQAMFAQQERFGTCSSWNIRMHHGAMLLCSNSSSSSLVAR